MFLEIIKFAIWYLFIGVFFAVPVVYHLHQMEQFLSHWLLWPILFSWYAVKLLVDPILHSVGMLAILVVMGYSYCWYENRQLQDLIRRFGKK